jgi:hypothetical protein
MVPSSYYQDMLVSLHVRNIHKGWQSAPHIVVNPELRFHLWPLVKFLFGGNFEFSIVLYVRKVLGCSFHRITRSIETFLVKIYRVKSTDGTVISTKQCSYCYCFVLTK